MPTANPAWIAFARHQRIAHGDPQHVLIQCKNHRESHPDDLVIVLDALTSQPVDIDWRGSLAAVLKRLPLPHPTDGEAADRPTGQAPRAPGRPKLGVVPREVTLLPRHWDWLGSQPGGASVALRKLVEAALRASAEPDRIRQATESAYRFMHTLAGDLAGFEEASRALFAGDLTRLEHEIALWPGDVRMQLLALASKAAPMPPAQGPVTGA